MLSNGVRIAYGIIAGLQLCIGVGLTVVLDRFLKQVYSARNSDDLTSVLTFVPISVYWGMVVPFYLTGLLGILATAVAKVPACAVYLTFCILALLAGVTYGAFSILMAVAAYGNDVVYCTWSAASAVTFNCNGSEISQLGGAVAGLHAAGWIITFVGSIFGCVGSCCSPPDNPQPTGPVPMVGMSTVVVQQPGAAPPYGQPQYGFGGQQLYAQPPGGQAFANPYPDQSASGTAPVSSVYPPMPSNSGKY